MSIYTTFEQGNRLIVLNVESINWIDAKVETVADTMTAKLKIKLNNGDFLHAEITELTTMWWGDEIQWLESLLRKIRTGIGNIKAETIYEVKSGNPLV